MEEKKHINLMRGWVSSRTLSSSFFASVSSDLFDIYESEKRRIIDRGGERTKADARDT